MIFSTQQMKATYNFMAQADEPTIQSLLVRIETPQLKKILKTVERSIKNRDPSFNDSCRCQNCHMHAVNMEDGVELCDSCLSQ